MGKKFKENRVMTIANKVSYISLIVLFVLIPFTGLVLESFNIHIVTFNMIFGLYIFTVLTALIAKQWKLIVMATIGSLLIWAVTMGLSEVLWYCLKKYFDIDISY
ncbi:MAG: hypothetical protein E6149_08880, partial [Peptoniphilus harei]|nr:hypothetical protein [Peptoniphilus harei]